ncbi:MAG TPA: hemerythrin domain-containing protein [Blastocatellia bacterium]|nr:hemerythrin domain-containing protein [Blastocatellia bacterium]
MSALELLKADHEKVQALFEQVKATEKERQHKQLYKKIKMELETHMYIEEKVFYPTLKKQEEFKDQVLEAMEEHLQVKTLIRDMDRLADGNERFAAKLQVLMDNIEHHVEEEEEELFPQVEEKFSAEDLEKIGVELEAAKKDFTRKARAKAATSK